MKHEKYIELPTAQDFCRGDLTFEGQCCALGWAKELGLTERGYPLPGHPFQKAFIESAQELKLANSVNNGTDVAAVNDDVRNSKAKLAKCFEMAVEKLGYEVYE